MDRCRRLITSVDPGTTHLAICQVDATTKQPVYLMMTNLKRPLELAKWRRRHDAFVKRAKWVAVHAPPVFVGMKRTRITKKWTTQLQMVNKDGQLLIKHYRHAQMKKLKKALTEEERLDAIHALITQNPQLFAAAEHVLVEKQMKRSHTVTTTIFRAMLHGKSSTVNPESMKRHFKISKRDRHSGSSAPGKASYKTGKDSASLRVMLYYFDEHHFQVWFETLIRTCIAHHHAHMARYTEFIDACRAIHARVEPKKSAHAISPEKQWHPWFKRANTHYEQVAKAFEAWQLENITRTDFTEAFEQKLSDWWKALQHKPDWQTAERQLRDMVPFMAYYLNKWDDLLDAYLQAIYYIESALPPSPLSDE